MELKKIHQYIKWLGAKFRSLDKIVNYLPSGSIQYWIEPFCGSGIVYANLKHNGLVEQGILGDVCKWIVYSHKLVRDDLNIFFEKAKEYSEKIDAIDPRKNREEFCDYYLHVRKEFNRDLSIVDDDQIMRFIFLCKFGYNGLVRFTKKGGFCVPPGYMYQWTLDMQNMISFSNALKKAKLSILPYDKMLDKLKNLLTSTDAVYYDPPYVPTFFDKDHKEKCFGNYAGNTFNFYDIEKIKGYFDYFTGKGVHQIMSINDVPIIRDLFSDYIIEETSVFKMKPGTSGLSGKTRELIIHN